ncbi:MAG: hypothetical protein NDI77_13825 [Geobacteraceae bacterium]|nr:hypothetical protein [Geobacteraceae bacterium]
MNTGKVAVPYYGRLHRAKFGYERIFFIVEAGDVNDKDLDVRLGVWDHKKEQTLPQWLKNNGVESLVCREEPESHMRHTMAGLGIRVLNEGNSDASRLLQSLQV